MKKRIFSAVFFTAAFLLTVMTALTTVNFCLSAKTSAIKQLQNETQLIMKGVEDDGLSYFDGMTFDGYRVTWIKADGTVNFDSEADTGNMENHLEREEVQEALTGGYGEATRYSDSIMKQSYYVAYLMDDGTVMRLSFTQNSMFAMAVKSLYPLYIVLAAAFAAAVVSAYLVSKKTVEPLNKMDLEHPLDGKLYPEIQPLAKRIDAQHRQLMKDKEEAEKNALIRQEFTANVSHEMKTPLHVISGYSELIKEGIANDADVKDFASRIYNESNRMSKLVEDIMQLSKLDSGDADGEKTAVSLSQICLNVIDSLSLTAENSHVVIHSDVQDCEIIGFADVLHSLVYNLVDNAIKYNKEGGSVDVSLEINGLSQPVLTVSDTGIGLPSDQLDRIFERFYRVDKSHSREIGGTGLGLSIVKHAAIVHDAKIEVESTVGKGSIFRVIFPKN